MPELPNGYAGGGMVSASPVSGSDSRGTASFSPNNSANTKGSWVELIASTPHDANWVEIEFTSYGTTTLQRGFADIGIGSSTEQVLIPDIMLLPQGQGGAIAPILIPVFIPKGSRLTVRGELGAAGGGALAFFQVTVHLIAGTVLGGGSGPSRVSAYGATASTRGTNIDPGGTADTWSGWVEITSATDRDHRWLIVMVEGGDGAIATSDWRVDIGIGASTEEVLIPSMHFSGAGLVQDRPVNYIRHFPVFIPKGSRLSARARSSSNTDGDRDVWLKLYGAG